MQHLRNQLSPRQVGTCDGFDFRQKKRDERIRLEQERKIHYQQEEQRRLEVTLEEFPEDEVEDVIEEDADEEFSGPKEKKDKMIDVMGPISRTADARGLSHRDRTAIAAAVVNAVGVDIRKTNVNVYSAWSQAQKTRVAISNQIKEKFVCPEMVSLHWDGKIFKLKRNVTSNRVAVYVAGVDDDKEQKLLGAPETESGTGKAEAAVVLRLLESWKIKEQVAAMVFDTTTSNSSGEVGACRHVEDWLESPILWAACRHHVLELHIGRVVEVVTGGAKDPGVGLFCRLEGPVEQLGHQLRQLSDVQLQ